jgi:hypothetical protein
MIRGRIWIQVGRRDDPFLYAFPEVERRTTRIFSPSDMISGITETASGLR